MGSLHKTIVFALLAALMAGALVLPTVAFAEETTLCSEDPVETSCIEENVVEHVHLATGKKAELISPSTSDVIKCDVLFLGDTVEPSGAPLLVDGAFTYANYISPYGACTIVIEENGPSELEILKEGHETATVIGEGLVRVNCPFLICRYTGEGLTAEAVGSLLALNEKEEETNGTVSIENQPVHKEGGSFCSKEALLNIVLEPLEPLYIGGGGPLEAPTSLSTSLKGGGKEGEEITVAEGSKVKDTATLSGTNASTATGVVYYTIYKDKECTEFVTQAGEVTVEEGKVPGSEEKELEAGAVYYWQAEYSGDSMNEPSISTCSKEVEIVKAKVSLSTKLSGGGKEGEEIIVAEGSKVKDTATLSGTNASSATGTVDYAVYKDKACKELVTEAGKGKVEGTKAASSEEKELEADAVYYWQAQYLGDSLHDESTSTCSNEVLTVEPIFTPHKTALCTADDPTSACEEGHKPSSIDFKDSAVEFLTSLTSTKCEGLISG